MVEIGFIPCLSEIVQDSGLTLAMTSALQSLRSSPWPLGVWVDQLVKAHFCTLQDFAGWLHPRLPREN